MANLPRTISFPIEQMNGKNACEMQVDENSINDQSASANKSHQWHQTLVESCRTQLTMAQRLKKRTGKTI